MEAVRARALVLSSMVLGACSPGEAPRATPAPEKPAAEAPKGAAPGKSEPFADPKLTPPPPPAGAALLPDRKRPIYVQRCDPAHACADLLQPAGETHCRELDLDGFKNWRLPDREEVKRFSEVSGLEGLAGFHWTRTAFAEDAAQAWIVDPQAGHETTIPRTRRPFRVRCVFQP